MAAAYILRYALVVSTVIWFLIPTVLNLWPNVPHTTFGFKHIFSFVIFYSMGAYIKLYGSHITKKIGIIFTAIGFVGAFLGDILVDVLAMTDPAYMKQIFYFTQNDYGFFQLLLGIGLFIIFLKAKITYRPWINVVASTTFGIYLLHDNKLFLHYMWDNVLATYQYYDSIAITSVCNSCSGAYFCRRYDCRLCAVSFHRKTCDESNHAEPRANSVKG